MNQNGGLLTNHNKKFNEFDICVNGGGLCSLLLGCEILERDPLQKICIIDSEIVSCGNSAKDPGFGTRITFTHFYNDCRRIGVGRAVRSLKEKLSGLNSLLRHVNWDAGLVQWSGSYEIITQKDMRFLNYLDEANKNLEHYINKKVFEVRSQCIKKFDMNTEVVKALIFNNLEWHLNMGAILKKLMQKFQSLGGRYLTGAHVVDVQEVDTRVHNVGYSGQGDSGHKNFEVKLVTLVTPNNSLTIKCDKIAVFDTIPTTHDVCIITQPIKGIEFQTSFYLNKQKFFMRTVGNRLLCELRLENKSPDLETAKGASIEIIKRLFPNMEIKVDFSWTRDGNLAEISKTKRLLNIHSLAESLRPVYIFNFERIESFETELRLSHQAYNRLRGNRAKL